MNDKKKMSPINKISKARNRWLIAAFIASIPVSALAISAFSTTNGTFYDWASVGSNWSSGNPSLMVGSGNAGYTNSAVIGTGLYTYTNSSLIVGKWNKEVTGAYFVVGKGTSGTGNQKNAFEVHSDGSVIINEPQGDISMGIFTP